MTANDKGVLAVMDDDRKVLVAANRLSPIPLVISEHDEARAAVAELSAKAEAVVRTLEMPTLVKQSAKNANSGFIDWRDWCALKGEVAALRAALARCGGES